MRRLLATLVVLCVPVFAWAQPRVEELVAANTAAGGTNTAGALQLAVILSVVSLAPALILACTCFTRFVVVFSFLRNGLGVTGAPPNQILVGLSLFMTMFIMAPVAAEINTRAVQPYLAGQMSESQALEAATPAIQGFVLPRTRQEDLSLFYEFSNNERPRNGSDVPLRIAVPAFMLSELRTSFEMGLVILLPFLVIDIVVASVLMALGMVMLSPVTISMPIKLLVFLSVDGWHLLVSSLLRGVAT